MADNSNNNWKGIFFNDPNSKSPASNPSAPPTGQQPSQNNQGWFWKLFFKDHTPEAVGDAPSCLKPRKDAVFWGLHDISLKTATQHFMIMGQPGSGKSVAIELFVQSLVHRLRLPAANEHPEKLIILDVKGTFFSFLRAQGVPENDIFILDPFDERCAIWNIAKDINGDAAAYGLATLIIPSEPNASTPFFWQAAQNIVWAVIIALNSLRPERWTLRDLLLALSSEENISRLVNQVSEAKKKAAPFLNDANHFPAVHTSIMTKASRFETVAALWHARATEASTANSPADFSLSDWFSNAPSKQRHGVLLLAHKPKYIESLAPLNALLLRMISDELQTRPDVGQPHTWIVLDEFRWMKEVECMAQLLGVGRSKGASILLGLQDISGLRVIYGNDRADEILGHCVNKSFLRLGNATSAEWASKYFADREATETKISHTYSKENSVTHAKDVVTRPLFLSAEFLNLETPGSDPNSRMQGIHHIPSIGDPFSTDESAKAIFGMNRKPTAEEQRMFPNKLDRPTKDQKLKSWTSAEELDLLGPAPQSTHSTSKPNVGSAPLQATPPNTHPNSPTATTQANPQSKGATPADSPKVRKDLSDFLRRRTQQ
jgi:hypothetical protein